MRVSEGIGAKIDPSGYKPVGLKRRQDPAGNEATKQVVQHLVVFLLGGIGHADTLARFAPSGYHLTPAASPHNPRGATHFGLD